MDGGNATYSVDLEFVAIKLPPVTDVLVLGRKHPQGKQGILESFRFTAPEEFEMFDIGDEEPNVEAVLISRRILRRLPSEEVVAVLRRHVFPFVTRGEAVNVDFHLTMRVGGIKGEVGR